MKNQLDNCLVFIVSMVFITLTLPIYGYNISMLIFLLLPAIFFSTPKIKIDKNDYYMLGLLLGVFLFFLINFILRSEPLRLLDKSSRFLVFSGVLLVFIKYKMNSHIVFLSIIIGAISSGFCAIFQQISSGAERIGWHINPIQFGMFSILLSLLSIVIFNYFLIKYLETKNKKALKISIVALIASFSGFYASISSGSRGGWLAIPLFGFIFYRQYSDTLNFSKKLKFTVLIGFMVGLIFLYNIPQLNIKSRVLDAKVNISQYFDNNTIETTAGARLEMWRVAIILGFEEPVYGLGYTGYQEGVKRKIDSKDTSAFLINFNEPHNQFVDMFAKYGFSGLILILFLYFWPVKMFMQQYYQYLNSVQSTYALMGAVSMLAFSCFSLTHSFINKNGGLMVFLFCLTLFWALSKKPIET